MVFRKKKVAKWILGQLGDGHLGDELLGNGHLGDGHSGDVKSVGQDI